MDLTEFVVFKTPTSDRRWQPTFQKVQPIYSPEVGPFVGTNAKAPINANDGSTNNVNRDRFPGRS
jgi:hypothetical protein